MGSICPCLSPGEDLDEEQKREIAIGKDIDNRKFELMYQYVLHKESKFAGVKLIQTGCLITLRSKCKWL